MAPRDRSGGDDDDLKTKKNYFKRMIPGFKKKAKELSVLCDNSVGFVCYGPDKDDLYAWPEPQQDSPQSQSLPEIVGKFNAMSYQMRMSKACDLFDFPNLKGLSSDELRNLDATLDSHLVGIRQKKLSIGNSKKPKRKETEEDDHHLIRVSDNAKVASSLVDRSGFEALGFEELVLGSCAASLFSVSDFSEIPLLVSLGLGSVF